MAPLTAAMLLGAHTSCAVRLSRMCMHNMRGLGWLVGERVHCNLLGSVQHIHNLCLRSACATAVWRMLLWYQQGHLGLHHTQQAAPAAHTARDAALAVRAAAETSQPPLAALAAVLVAHPPTSTAASACCGISLSAALGHCSCTTGASSSASVRLHPTVGPRLHAMLACTLGGINLLVPLHGSRLLTNPLQVTCVFCSRRSCACCVTARGGTGYSCGGRGACSGRGHAIGGVGCVSSCSSTVAMCSSVCRNR
jgi:hypothetical protein